MERLTLDIRGMNCEHCIRAVTHALTGLDGVRVDRVGMGVATLEYDPRRVSTEAIVDAVNDEGYTASLAALPAAS